jgi:hypothetical protein
LTKIELLHDTSLKQAQRIENIEGCKRKKQKTYKGKLIKITDFSMETLKARRAWSEVFQALNENNFNPRKLCSAKLSFKIDGAIKVFHDKQKLKQYMTTMPPLREILQRIPHTEVKANKPCKGRQYQTIGEEKARK